MLKYSFKFFIKVWNSSSAKNHMVLVLVPVLVRGPDPGHNIFLVPAFVPIPVPVKIPYRCCSITISPPLIAQAQPTHTDSRGRLKGSGKNARVKELKNAIIGECRSARMQQY